MAFDPLKDEVYYCKENCSQIIEKYSIKTGEKSAIITKKEVLPVLVNCLCVSMDDIKKFSIEELYYSKEEHIARKMIIEFVYLYVGIR